MLDCKLGIFNSVAEPEESYIHAFGTFCIYCARSQTLSDRIVDHDSSGYLWVA